MSAPIFACLLFLLFRFSVLSGGQANDLYADIARLPRDAAIRKVNDLIKRARLAKVRTRETAMERPKQALCVS